MREDFVTGILGDMNPAQDLHTFANQLRIDVLTMVHRAGAGHIAGPMSSAEFFAALYLAGAADLTQDKIVLSCGHYCPILYSALARAKYFEVEELSSFMQTGSRLPGHPEKGVTPGVEVSAGPLGQGVSVATGMALAMKLKSQMPNSSIERRAKVFCVLSDGEIQEGQVWEAFNFAVRRQLDNLIFILDRNKVQIENYVSQLASYGELSGRMEAFGLHVIEVDGNDIEAVLKAIERARQVMAGPVMIIGDTVAGKGVSFMENKPLWHDKVPSDEELKQAMIELGGEL